MTITATPRATGETSQVDVTVESAVAVADPVAYVSTDANVAVIIAQAGLNSTLELIDADLQTSTSLGGVYYYVLICTFGDVPTGVTTHTHDHTTLTFPLQQAYQDGTTIAITSTHGAVKFTAADDTSVDYLRIQTDTDTTTRDILWVKQGSVIRFGAHQEFFSDATYDVGTPDAGVTLRRPRDVRLSRNLLVGGTAAVTSYGTFGGYVLGSHHRFTAQAANPDATAPNRHIYVNSGDNSLRFWDGASDVVLAGGAGTSGDTVGLYSCAAGVTVGAVVSFTGVADTVTEANATTLNGATIAGVVVAKPTATTASVKYVGETGAVFAGALAIGAQYYVGRVAGTITNNLSAFTTGDTQLPVGVAKNADTLVIRIGEPYVE